MKKRIFNLALAAAGAAALITASLQAFNNDGHTDILWRDYSTHSNHLWTMSNLTLIASSQIRFVADANWKMIGTGDFNNDAQLDIIWQYDTTGQNSVWRMNGTNYLDSLSLPYAANTGWKLAGAGYFSGYTDKHVDLLFRHNTTGQNQIWFMNGTNKIGDATLPTISDLNYRIGGIGDFNGDGHPDILWRHYQAGLNSIWIMDGATYLYSVSLPTVSDINWEIVGTGHFNSDAHIDILWRHSTGVNSVWLMNGTSQLSTPYIPSNSTLSQRVGGTGDSRVDSDGDGLPDLWEKIHFGTLDQRAYGDYDGDGISNVQEFMNGTNPATTLGLQVFTPLQ
jgi:hypothetical protein